MSDKQQTSVLFIPRSQCAEKTEEEENNIPPPENIM